MVVQFRSFVVVQYVVFCCYYFFHTFLESLYIFFPEESDGTASGAARERTCAQCSWDKPILEVFSSSVLPIESLQNHYTPENSHGPDPGRMPLLSVMVFLLLTSGALRVRGHHGRDHNYIVCNFMWEALLIDQGRTIKS